MTCGGKLVGTPKGKTSLDGCAQACDEQVHSCVGFSYFGKEKLCFLMSKFSTALYYTGCKTGEQLSFLQKSEQADVTCMAKFSKFEGTTLKPDPSGKCKQCLKKLTKADRCYISDKGAAEAPAKAEEKEVPQKTFEDVKQKTFEEKPDDEIAEEVMDDGEMMDDDWEMQWDDEFDEGNNHDYDYDDEWKELNLHARKGKHHRVH